MRTTDWVHVKSGVSTRTTLLQIVDAVIGIFLMGTIITLFTGVIVLLK